MQIIQIINHLLGTCGEPHLNAFSIFCIALFVRTTLTTIKKLKNE